MNRKHADAAFLLMPHEANPKPGVDASDADRLRQVGSLGLQDSRIGFRMRVSYFVETPRWGMVVRGSVGF